MSDKHSDPRTRTFLGQAPLVLGVWVFLPIFIVGIVGIVLRTPSSLHGITWMLRSFFQPGSADDSWMPMSVALEVSHGPRASEIFQAVFFERGIKFQYPPSSLLPLEPLAYFGVLQPKLLNALNSFLITANAILVGLFAHRLFAPDATRAMALPDRRWAALLATAAGFVFYPIVQAQNIGQIQTWINLLFTLACFFWVRGKGTLAGGAIGLACALKPQLALFLPWALVWRKWDFATGLLVCSVPIGVASLLRYGLPNHISYLGVLSHLSRHGESFQFNQSINGLFHRLLFNGCNICPPSEPTPLPPFHPFVHGITLVGTVGFLVLSCWPALSRRARAPSLVDFAIATLCFTMASPVAWYHHYGVALPLFVIALRTAYAETDQRSARISLWLLGVAWVLAANYIGAFNLLAASRLNPLQSHLFFGAAILLGLLVRAQATATSARAPSRVQR